MRARPSVGALRTALDKVEVKDVQVSLETVGTRQVELTVEPDAERMRRAMRQAARRISKMRPVAGFRPGKAPYAMVERIFGRELILNEALGDQAQDIYREAIQEAEIEPFEQGELDIESEDPLVLKIRVPLIPEVTLGDYAELTIEPEPEIAVSDQEIEEELEALQRQQAEYEPVERPIQMSDQVIAALLGTTDDEKVIDQQNATLNVSEEMNPPGFAEAIAGASKDERREFTLTYPEDFATERLAGKTVAFDVTVKEVRQTNLPPIDDELAKAVGEYETLQELRDEIAKAIYEQKESAARSRETRAAVEALVAISTVEYPEAALEQEIEQAINTQRNQLAQMGYSFEAYLQMVNQTEEDLRAQLRPEAEKNLIERLVVGEYARREEIDLTPDEMQNEFRSFAGSMYRLYGERAEEAIRNATMSGALASVYADARVRKAALLLADRMAGRETEAPEPAEQSNPELDEFIEATQENADQE